MPLIFPPGIRCDRACADLCAWRCDLWRTATYVVTWLVGVTGDPLGVDLLRHGGECRVFFWPPSPYEIRTITRRRLAIGLGSRNLTTNGASGSLTSAILELSFRQKSKFNRS